MLNANKLKCVYVCVCVCVYVCIPLEAQPHLVGQSMKQQHRLPPGCIDLIPLHWDTRESTQAEVVDGTKLAAVPKKRQTIKILSQLAVIFFFLEACVSYFLGTIDRKRVILRINYSLCPYQM